VQNPCTAHANYRLLNPLALDSVTAAQSINECPLWVESGHWTVPADRQNVLSTTNYKMQLKKGNVGGSAIVRRDSRGSAALSTVHKSGVDSTH